jgi:hypothetical protein
MRNRSLPHIKILLTILNIGRIIKKEVVPVYETINGPLREIKTLKEVWLKGFVDKHKLNRRSVEEPKLRIRHSAGPMGPAMTSVIAEAHSMPDEMFSSIRTLIEGTEKGDEIIGIIRTIKTHDYKDLAQGFN